MSSHEPHLTLRRKALAVATITVVLVVLAVRDDSVVVGLLVGILTGGAIASVWAYLGIRAARGRQSDQAALDRLEPLRRDQP